MLDTVNRAGAELGGRNWAIELGGRNAQAARAHQRLLESIKFALHSIAAWKTNSRRDKDELCHAEAHLIHVLLLVPAKTLNLAYAQMGHLRLGQLYDTLFTPLWWPLQMWLAALSKQGIFVHC